MRMYSDPTGEQAVGNAMKASDDVRQVVNMMRAIARVAGFEVIGHIQLKDRTTGREWK